MNLLKAPSPLAPLPQVGEGNKPAHLSNTAADINSPRPRAGEGTGERVKDLIITTEHLRNIDGYCVAGAKAFGELYGMDFKRFVREGIPASELIKTGDALALKMVELAQQYEAEKTKAGEVN